MTRVQRLILGVGLSLIAAVLLVGCGSSGPSAAATGSARPVGSTSVSTTTPAASSAAAAIGQTDTPWGRIWDTLPSGFPAVAGSTPSEEAATGPASATLVVQGDAAKSIVTAMQTALEAADFRTQGLAGPLEDGTYILDSVGLPAGCMVQVTASPLGGVTTVVILYGAVCPHG
jgi:hypothetical protein